ncbi:AAA family ATPase [Anaerolineales bacterium HSG25]|nr:AAA family ATPase [Anaerolineales bacterium HSG25]
MLNYKPIPYGVSNYKRIVTENYYYVDKTDNISKLEETGKFLFLIRPRRFGKSSLLTVLECYYDLARANEFDTLFKGTYIHDQPTSEKNSYLILKFNFSHVDSDTDKVEESFHSHVSTVFYFFWKSYRDILGEEFFKLLELQKNAHQKLEFTLRYVGSIGHNVYVLIDEYDNFTNSILSTSGQSAYHEVTQGAGFLRFFFNLLKGAVDQVDSGVGRMFITGVSPVTMDDVTSGFNIGQSISLHPTFNELLGFTEQDVRELLVYYQTNANLVIADIEQDLALLKEWCGNYCFYRPHDSSAQTQVTMFNTDMILYLVQKRLQFGRYPDHLIDQNVRVDYGKLRHLIVIDRRLNGNFSYLSKIIEQQQTDLEQVVDSFPVERLTKPSNFVSLLYYFGLLSYTAQGRLGIPNQTVKQLMYSYLREGYEDIDVFNVDLIAFTGLMRRLAYQGDWQPVFQFLADEVEKQTAIRDYLTGEKVIQTFLLAYLNLTDYYTTRTEEEFGKGFVDLYLEPFWTKYKDLPYSYLIELKYIPRHAFTTTLLTEKLTEAETQLKQYAHNPVILKRQQSAKLICVALVFSGWELKGLKQV